jgi:hypothetical protein
MRRCCWWTISSTIYEPRRISFSMSTGFWGETVMHELFMVNGFFHMMARYTESLRIEVDAAQKGNALDRLKALRSEL